MKYFCKEIILLATVLLLGPVTYGPACAATISSSVSSEVIPVSFKQTPEEAERAEKLQQEENIKAEKGAKPEEPNKVSDFMRGFGFGFIKIPKKIIQYFQGSEPDDAYDRTPPETPAHQLGVFVGWITFLLMLGSAVKNIF